MEIRKKTVRGGAADETVIEGDAFALDETPDGKPLQGEPKPAPTFRPRPCVVSALSRVVLHALAESARLFALREQWRAAL
jgi:hypothetical protein